jgi:hypothetical protein
LLTQLPEDELLIEFHVNTFLCFAGSTALSASCLWAFGGTVDKTANSELFSAISLILQRYLEIAPERIRITRVQLYEILDHKSKVYIT